MFHFSWMKFKWDSQKNDLNKLKHHKRKDLTFCKVLPFIYYSAASSSVSSGISALRGAMTLTTGASI